MKIAFVAQNMIVGGAETYIARKAKWLGSHGHKVIVISPNGNFIEFLPKEVVHYTLQTNTPPFLLSPHRLKKLLIDLSTIIQEEKVDLIESFDKYPIVYVAMSYSLHRTPYCLNVLLELAYSEGTDKQLCWLTRYLDKEKLYFTLTEEMNQYISLYCRKQLSPIIFPIPVDIPKKTPSESEDYLLTVCRLTYDKMYLRYLINGYEKVAYEHTIGTKLLIVGDGILHDEIQEMVLSVNKKIGRDVIQLLGTVVGEKLDSLFSKCKAYIGVGTSLLMAASFSKPSIIAGIEENMPYTFGYWGQMPQEDIKVICGSSLISYRKKSYYDTLMDVLALKEEELTRIGADARTLVEENYALETIMKKWEKCYKAISLMDCERKLKAIAGSLYLYNVVYHYCRLPYKLVENVLNLVR